MAARYMTSSPTLVDRHTFLQITNIQSIKASKVTLCPARTCDTGQDSTVHLRVSRYKYAPDKAQDRALRAGQ